MLEMMMRRVEILHGGPHRLPAPAWQPAVDVVRQADGSTFLRPQVVPVGVTVEVHPQVVEPSDGVVQSVTVPVRQTPATLCQGARSRASGRARVCCSGSAVATW